jgi:hypothetical protein
MSSLRYGAPGAVLVASLSAWFWAPALFLGKTTVHGDSIIVGIPFIDLLARALHGKDAGAPQGPRARDTVADAARHE